VENLQQFGIDYDTTIPPVVGFTVVRMMMLIATKKGYKVHQMDVKTAFLNGDLDVDVCLRIPKEIQGMYGSDKVCHHRRSLYGLKQAPRIWYETLWADLISKGFEVSKSCLCCKRLRISRKLGTRVDQRTNPSTTYTGFGLS
jgi:Reverse transcriptase (RNA-dependent DNA polymerase)